MIPSALARAAPPILLCCLCAACHMDGRSARAQQLLSEFAPLSLGEPLSLARRQVPRLRVRHPGDRWTQSVEVGATGMTLAGVTVSPAPADGEEASPTAHVESVQFVLTEQQARHLATRAQKLFGPASRTICAGRSIAEMDTIVMWPRDRRGGVLITFPARRIGEEPNVARLIIYSSGWDPQRSMSNFDVMSCPV